MLTRGDLVRRKTLKGEQLLNPPGGSSIDDTEISLTDTVQLQRTNTSNRQFTPTLMAPREHSPSLSPPLPRKNSSSAPVSVDDSEIDIPKKPKSATESKWSQGEDKTTKERSHSDYRRTVSTKAIRSTIQKSSQIKATGRLKVEAVASISAPASHRRKIGVLGAAGVGKTIFVNALVALRDDKKRKKDKRFNFSIGEWNVGSKDDTKKARCIVLYDVCNAQSLSIAETEIETIKKRGVKKIILIANKIDLMCSMNDHDTLLHGWKLSKELGCKFLAITLHPFINCKSNIPEPSDTSLHQMNNRNLAICLYLLFTSSSTLLWRRKANQMENSNLIFDDYLPITEEVNIVLSHYKNDKPQSIEAEKHYAVVKGNFLFLFHHMNPQNLKIIYLRACDVKECKDNRTITIEIALPSGDLFSLVSASRKSQLTSFYHHCMIPTISLSLYESSDDYEESGSNYPLFHALDVELKCLLPEGFATMSSLYNISHRIQCVDCSTMGCSFISKQNRTFLCDRCASYHRSTFDHITDIITLSNCSERKGLGPCSNEYFNLLFEGKLSLPIPPSNILPTTEKEQHQYILSKYKDQAYYSCPSAPLYVKTCKNMLETWEARFADITKDGELQLFEDIEKMNLVEVFHISWCSFRAGRDVGLDANYFHIIGPHTSNLFRTSSSDVVTMWYHIIQSTQTRIKAQAHSRASPSFPPSHIRRSMSNVVQADTISSVTIQDLLMEKNHLVGIRKLKTQRMAIRERLLVQLQETNAEIDGLCKSETKSLSKISSLEPLSVVHDIQELSLLLSSDLTSTISDHGSSSKEDISSPHTIKGKPASLLTPRFDAFSLRQDSNRWESVQDDMASSDTDVCQFDANSGYIKNATVNFLISSLLDQFYQEEAYPHIFLFSFPYFMTPMMFIHALSKRFATAHISKKKETKLSKNEKKDRTITVLSTLDLKKLVSRQSTSTKQLAFASPSRMIILNILEIWMSNFWSFDFQHDPRLIVYMISFLDYIVHPIAGFSQRASTIRNLLEEKHRQQSSILIKRSVITCNLSEDNTIMNFMLETDIADMAKQLTIHNSSIFHHIHPREFFDKSWTRAEKSTRCPNIVTMIEEFNRISMWASSVIVLEPKVKLRAKLMERFITLASHCFEFSNFHAVVALVGGLQDPAVARCRKAWSLVSSKVQGVFDDLKEFLLIQGNWLNYRTRLGEVMAQGLSCVPYIGIVLKDLMFIEDGISQCINTTEKAPKLINFDKNRKLFSLIERIRLCQEVPYDFDSFPVVYQCIQQILTIYPLLDDQARFEQSLLVEPKKGKVGKNKIA